jgi:hypothetical protein
MLTGVTVDEVCHWLGNHGPTTQLKLHLALEGLSGGRLALELMGGVGVWPWPGYLPRPDSRPLAGALLGTPQPPCYDGEQNLEGNMTKKTEEVEWAPVDEGEYCTVVVMEGEHKGRMGLYDDDDGENALVYLDGAPLFTTAWTLIPRRHLRAAGPIEARKYEDSYKDNKPLVKKARLDLTSDKPIH